jgi:hypothetical protein
MDGGELGTRSNPPLPTRRPLTEKYQTKTDSNSNIRPDSTSDLLQISLLHNPGIPNLHSYDFIGKANGIGTIYSS